MKDTFLLLGLLFAMGVGFVGRAGITGAWKAEDVAFAPWTFTLRAEGAKVTGTVSQGASSGTMTTTLTGATVIHDGAIEGNKVSFTDQTPG
ncbi:MAG: hypothetical protein ACLQVX_21625 [Limisphaerales bacterium]